jgi:hypothetical protein
LLLLPPFLVEGCACWLLLQALFTESCAESCPPPSLVERASWLLLQALFTESSHGEQLLAHLPSPVCSKHPTLSAARPFQFLVYYSVCLFVCFCRVGVSLFRGLCSFIPVVAVELASGSVGALLVLQYNMVWRSFVQAGGSGCWSFASSWWFFPAKCGSSVSARFLICGAHAIYFLPLVTILDLLPAFYLITMH